MTAKPCISVCEIAVSDDAHAHFLKQIAERMPMPKDAATAAQDALRAFNDAREDRRTHPATIQRLWDEYCAAAEREIEERKRAEAAGEGIYPDEPQQFWLSE